MTIKQQKNLPILQQPLNTEQKLPSAEGDGEEDASMVRDFKGPAKQGFTSTFEPRG